MVITYTFHQLLLWAFTICHADHINECLTSSKLIQVQNLPLELQWMTRWPSYVTSKLKPLCFNLTMSIFFWQTSSVFHLFDLLSFDIFLEIWHVTYCLKNLSPSQGHFLHHSYRLTACHGHLWWHCGRITVSANYTQRFHWMYSVSISKSLLFWRRLRSIWGNLSHKIYYRVYDVRYSLIGFLITCKFIHVLAGLYISGVTLSLLVELISRNEMKVWQGFIHCVSWPFKLYLASILYRNLL